MLALPPLLDALAPAPQAPQEPAPAARAPAPEPPARAHPPRPPTARQAEVQLAAAQLAKAQEERAMAGEEPQGISVFNPPGTKPIKRGLVVPEGFALPPGYVRHYQTLDDGRQLPAVLMFHPDAHPTDAQGRPVAIPPDGLVPPELAPPGLPLEVLTVPEPLPERVPEPGEGQDG
nr:MULTISPECIES: hypothetical protein [Myxococcaceae]